MCVCVHQKMSLYLLCHPGKCSSGPTDHCSYTERERVTSSAVPFFAGSEVLSSLGVALAAYLSLYPVVLLLPFTIMSYKVLGDCND